MTQGGAVTPERVHAASAAWLWWPEEAEVLRTDQLLLVRWPDHYGEPPTLLHVARDAADAVDDVLDAAVTLTREWGADRLVVWVQLAAPASLEPALEERGSEVHEVLDVLALDLTAARPDLAVPEDLEVRWQDDEATTRDALAVAAAAFETGSVPDDETVRTLTERAVRDRADGRGGTVVVYADGGPVATGGLSLVDGVARLWGGGVAPGARGRGAYRAALDARLREAARRGATLALVKGRVETSGPVLRRAGFSVFGRERAHLLRLDRRDG